MKMKHLSLLLAALLVPVSLHAVPAKISYQGIITDANGSPIGNTSPENRDAIFRVWKVATGGGQADLVFSETQTVTVSKGEFSVLIGMGTETPATASPLNEANLFGASRIATAFDGGDRYLEVTIADNTGSLSTPISPRQQIVSTAYAVRATEAETVVQGAIDTDALGASAVTLVNMATSSVNSSTLVDGSINSVDLANAAVTADKLAGDIGVWSLNGANVYRASGNVGVGTVSPEKKLHVRTSTATGTPTQSTASMIIEGNGNHFLQMKVGDNSETGVLFGTPDSANDGGIVYDDNSNSGDVMEFRVSNNSTKMVIKNNGNVGVGTVSPEKKLHVRTSTATGTPTQSTASMIIEGNGDHFLQMKVGDNNETGVLFGTPDSASDGGIVYDDNSTSGDVMEFRVSDDSTKMVIKNTGRVGIGTTNPGYPLDVQGSVNTGFVGGTRWFNHQVDLNFIPADFPTSINSQHYVRAFGFVAVSDRRIKTKIEAADSTQDLQKIQALQVRDYSMIDTVDSGNSRFRGFIAQEVEKVIPEAIQLGTQVIPSIYKVADSLKFSDDNTTCTVVMKTPHGLIVGDQVRVISDDGPQEVQVTSIPNELTFTFGTVDQTWKRLFVYGKKVDDFRSVDYPRLFTTAISALQEVKREKDREVQKLEQENQKLKERIAALETSTQAQTTRITQLEARDAKRGQRLSAIESLLKIKENGQPETVSVK